MAKNKNTTYPSSEDKEAKAVLKGKIIVINDSINQIQWPWKRQNSNDLKAQKKKGDITTLAK